MLLLCIKNLTKDFINGIIPEILGVSLDDEVLKVLTEMKIPKVVPT